MFCRLHHVSDAPQTADKKRRLSLSARFFSIRAASARMLEVGMNCFMLLPLVIPARRSISTLSADRSAISASSAKTAGLYCGGAGPFPCS